MDIEKIILLALGMQPKELKIERIEHDQQKLKLNITVRQLRDQCLCPVCDKPIYGVKQWRKKTLWGIPIGAFLEVEIIFYQLQGACAKCLTNRLSKASFIHPAFRQMTTAFAEYCGRLMEETTCAAVERLTGCPSMSLWRLDQWRMKKMKKEFPLPTNLDMTLASADEVHMYSLKPSEHSLFPRQRERKFITNLVSYNLSKVVANANGRSSRSLKTCLNQLTSEHRDKIKFIAVDMHDGYINTASKLCPNAEVTVDRFHVAQKLNEAFDAVRKLEFEKAKNNNDQFQEEMLMPSKKFILMEREKKLSQEEKKSLEKLREMNVNIHTGMLLVEYFHKVLEKKNIESFRKGLENWKLLLAEANLPPFDKFFKTVRKYQSRIEVYIKSHLTTAVSEGINNKIKVLKRVGYTYTNRISFKNKILQRCGFLNSVNNFTNNWFWRII